MTDNPSRRSLVQFGGAVTHPRGLRRRVAGGVGATHSPVWSSLYMGECGMKRRLSPNAGNTHMILPKATKVMLAMLPALFIPTIAEALTIEQMNAVKDAVIELCRGGTLEGNATNYVIEGKGEIKSVIIPKLLDAGVKGQVTFSEGEWKGIQASIPKEPDQSAWNECATQITALFTEKLQNIASIPVPGAPSGDLLQSPESAKMAETIDVSAVQGSIGIYSCSNQKESMEKTTIVCFFVLNRTRKGPYDYSIKNMTTWLQPRLIDEFGVEHDRAQFYFLNGRGQKQSSLNIDAEDRAWFAVEFADGASDITNARILIRNGGQLHARISMLPKK